MGIARGGIAGDAGNRFKQDIAAQRDGLVFAQFNEFRLHAQSTAHAEAVQQHFVDTSTAPNGQQVQRLGKHQVIQTIA